MPLGADTALVDPVAGSNETRILLEKLFGLVFAVISHFLLPAPAPILSCPMARIRTESREWSFIEIPASHGFRLLMQSL